MLGWQFRWRALVPALGLGTCVAWAAADAAHAQGAAPSGPEGLVYEKLLDLSLNPARADEATPPPPEHQDDFVEKSFAMEGLVPDADARSRIIHGTKARDGEWPAAVHIIVSHDARMPDPSACGGTIISSTWILTAAHCVFFRKGGGLRSLRWVTASTKSVFRFEGGAKRFEGEVLRVKRAIVHPEFGKTTGLLNDIAILELEKPTTAARQKLTAQAGQSTFLAPGTTATVIGWGVTRPLQLGEKAGPADSSKVLLKANVPIADRQACAGFLERPVAGAEFCAGDGKGGPDACNGDSGGPLFVAGNVGEALQAGIVSWGKGCALPGTYGVYASVGHFEQWIRQHVPGVQFAMPRPPAPALAQIAGYEPGAPAAARGQVTVDLVVHDCPQPNNPFPVRAIRAAAANRIKVGSCITVQVTSGVTGHLGVFGINAKGTPGQIFPNVYSGRQVGQAPTKVLAGQVIKVPGPADAPFQISAPLGRNELIAIVVPEGVKLDEITKRFEGMRSIENFENMLDAIARQVNVVPTGPRAVGSRQFDVVE